MAKAKPIACDAPAADPQSWLAEVLLVRFDEVASYAADAVQPDGIKGVHDMRVATRRLRSVLGDFERIIDVLPSKNLRKDLKKFSDALGAVRDEDVAIAALEHYSEKTEDKRIHEGIDRLIEKRRDSRKKAFRDLTKTLSPESLKKLRSRLAVGIKAPPKQRKLFHPNNVSEAARETIIARANDLFEHGVVIFEPNKNKALHKLRLDAKRLRYAIELFAACLGDAVLPYAAEVAKLQGHLGEVHDCDLWIKTLAARLKDKEDNTDAHEAEAWLLSELVKKRSKEYRAALELWVEWEQVGFEKKLAEVIEKSVEENREVSK